MIWSPSCSPFISPEISILHGKAVTRHANNQCCWRKIVFGFKVGEDVLELNMQLETLD